MNILKKVDGGQHVSIPVISIESKKNIYDNVSNVITFKDNDGEEIVSISFFNNGEDVYILDVLRKAAS